MSEERGNQKVPEYDSSSLRRRSSDSSEQSVSPEISTNRTCTRKKACTQPQLHVEHKTVVEMRNKATRIQMEAEWRDSQLYIDDINTVISMRETGIYKNVYEQYSWYLDQVFERHSEYFSERMAEINESKQKRGIKRKCETLQHVVRFQEEYEHKLTGRRGGVYMGFSEDNVKEQFGLSLESLLIFKQSCVWYANSMTTYTAVSPKCLVEQLKTRMLSNDNVQYLNRVHFKLPSVLSEAVDVISKLTTTTSDTPR